MNERLSLFKGCPAAAAAFRADARPAVDAAHAYRAMQQRRPEAPQAQPRGIRLLGVDRAKERLVDTRRGRTGCVSVRLALPRLGARTLTLTDAWARRRSCGQREKENKASRRGPHNL
eukprot:199724-Pleurochrysis_carterae.AAC.1